LFTAFNKKTGAMIWTALADKPAGYAPPMIVNAGGKRQLICWSPNQLASVDPETGKLYWKQAHGPIKNGVSIATPRFVHDAALGDLLLVSSANEGCLVMKLDADAPKASVFWKRGGTSERKTDAIQSLMAPVSIRDGHIYGVCIGGELRCLDLKNGDRIWETYAATSGDVGHQSWATAFVIPLGDSGSKYLLANDSGDLILANLTAAGYAEISRTHLLDPTNTDAGRPVLWCHPALAGKCVFWRNDKEMVCASMAGG
jgi:outer membrane protein assembly factor BamB